MAYMAALFHCSLRHFVAARENRAPERPAALAHPRCPPLMSIGLSSIADRWMRTELCMCMMDEANA